MTILLISSKRNKEPVPEDHLMAYLKEKLHCVNELNCSIKSAKKYVYTLLKPVSSLVINRKDCIINWWEYQSASQNISLSTGDT